MSRLTEYPMADKFEEGTSIILWLAQLFVNVQFKNYTDEFGFKLSLNIDCIEGAQFIKYPFPIKLQPWIVTTSYCTLKRDV